jgi:hypothetical protein
MKEPVLHGKSWQVSVTAIIKPSTVLLKLLAGMTAEGFSKHGFQSVSRCTAGTIIYTSNCHGNSEDFYGENITFLYAIKLNRRGSHSYCHDLRGCVTYKTGFGLDDWINFTLYIHTVRDSGNTALSLFYTLSNSPLNTHYSSQASLVVSWQRIYHNLTITSNHT